MVGSTAEGHTDVDRRGRSLVSHAASGRASSPLKVLLGSLAAALAVGMLVPMTNATAQDSTDPDSYTIVASGNAKLHEPGVAQKDSSGPITGGWLTRTPGSFIFGGEVAVDWSGATTSDVRLSNVSLEVPPGGGKATLKATVKIDHAGQTYSSDGADKWFGVVSQDGRSIDFEDFGVRVPRPEDYNTWLDISGLKLMAKDNCPNCYPPHQFVCVQPSVQGSFTKPCIAVGNSAQRFSGPGVLDSLSLVAVNSAANATPVADAQGITGDWNFISWPLVADGTKLHYSLAPSSLIDSSNYVTLIYQRSGFSCNSSPQYLFCRTQYGGIGGYKVDLSGALIWTLPLTTTIINSLAAPLKRTNQFKANYLPDSAGETPSSETVPGATKAVGTPGAGIVRFGGLRAGAGQSTTFNNTYSFRTADGGSGSIDFKVAIDSNFTPDPQDPSKTNAHVTCNVAPATATSGVYCFPHVYNDKTNIGTMIVQFHVTQVPNADE